MLACMRDSAHDCQHIYRVLFTALDIAQYEKSADADVLIAACLLHDIGRKEELEDSRLCHALVGAEKAKAFLLENGFEKRFANRVAQCIKKHRFRSDEKPERIEEKILFDADKLDAAGLLGIARTFLYEGKADIPMYLVNGDFDVDDGAQKRSASFFSEYNFKLKNVYDGFFTARAVQIAERQKNAAQMFYNELLSEIRGAYNGKQYLSKYIY